jgi:hypothetical protein
MIAPMTARSDVDFETPLANAVRDYLRQEPNERISEDEHLREVCRWLAPLLNRLLRGEIGWGPYRSVDTLEPCTATRVSPCDLRLEAVVIWMTDTRGHWIDPLSASIHISEQPLEPLGYRLQFGNAARGLGKCGYGCDQDFPYVPVTDWMFSFGSESHTVAVEAATK